MRIAVLQLAPDLRGQRMPRFEPQLGILLALLRARGHELSLTGLARFDLSAIKSAMARTLPQLVYADINPVCADVARRTLEHIARHEFLPIVVGGAYASVAPAEALSLPGVTAAALGEPDASLVTYFERVQDPSASQIVHGVWLRDEQGTAQPHLPHLVEDLDSLPFAERELFDTAAVVQATGTIDLAVGRGCPQQCGYCLLPAIEALYDAREPWVRRRSVENVLAEIAGLRERYAGVRRVRFLDHAFALDADWLHDFLARYAAECGLPFRCHLRANRVDDPQAQQLAAAGCRMADVEVISGSDLIRNEIFEMELTAEQIAAAFGALRAAGIVSRAILYLGAPYESDASLESARQLLLDIRPDVVDVRPYFPYAGTPARALCHEQGWLHARGEEQFHHDRCGIDMPVCRPDRVASFVRRLRGEFPVSLAEPWWRRWSLASRSALGQMFQRRRVSGPPGPPA